MRSPALLTPDGLLYDELLTPLLCSLVYEGFPIFATGAPTAYAPAQSIKLDASLSQDFTRALSGAGTGRKFTISWWEKRSKLGANQRVMHAGTLDFVMTGYSNSDEIRANFQTVNGVTTSRLSRDPAAWRHVVWAVDTTISSPTAERARLYINGVEETSFSRTEYPALNAVTAFGSTNTHYIGSYISSSEYFDGLLCDFAFVDGSQLGPTAFGEFDEYGVWRATDPAIWGVTWGTDGFLIQDASGADQSGNGNDFTPNNSPTNSKDVPGDKVGANRGNYARWSPIDRYSSFTVSKAGTRVTCPPQGKSRATFYVSSGSWYWETEFVSATGSATIGATGIAATNSVVTPVPGDHAGDYFYYATGDTKNNSSYAAYGATFTTGDIIGHHLDLDAGTYTFYKNGVSQGTAFSGLSGTFAPAAGCASGTYTHVWDGHFEPDDWTYSAPSGAKPLCTAHLPTKAPGPRQYGHTTLWTGTGAAQDVTFDDMTETVCWFLAKSRNASSSWLLTDTPRGLANVLFPDATNVETAPSANDQVQSFGAGTVGLGADTGGYFNYSGRTYVGLALGGFTAMSSGDIAALVSSTGATITPTAVYYNATTGRVILLYTGTGAAGTLPHPLGKNVDLAIAKGRGSTGTGNAWPVYARGVGPLYSLYLEDAGAAAPDSTVWNNTDPTDELISIGSWNGINASGVSFVMYGFANTDHNYIGVREGNNSSDGSVVPCGFRAGAYIGKSVDYGYSWIFECDALNAYNPTDRYLQPDLTAAEVTTAGSNFGDFNSNNIKWRDNGGKTNGAGTYLDICFAAELFGGGVTQGKAH